MAQEGILVHLALFHQVQVLLPIGGRDEVMNERLLDRDRALVDRATEGTMPGASFADGGADVGRQAAFAKGMPAIAPDLLGLGLGVTSKQRAAALALGKERLEADGARLFLQVVVDVRGGGLRQLLLRAAARTRRGGRKGRAVGGITATAPGAGAGRALPHHLSLRWDCSVRGGKGITLCGEKR